MSELSHQDESLDSLMERIVQARDDLEQFNEDYTKCQKLLNKELEKRIRLDVENLSLKRRNSQLETELHHVKTILREANLALEQSTLLRKAVDQREVLLTEKIELLKWELKKAKTHAIESDRLTQKSVKRINNLTDRLTNCENKLGDSLASNEQLLADLRATGKKSVGLNEHTNELAYHQGAIVERKIQDLHEHLSESERRAKLAEMNVKQLQEASDRLEKRWHDRLNELSKGISVTPDACKNTKGEPNF